MSEIRTAISIVDGMTPAFKSMNTAMDIVINNFQQLQSASGNSIDDGSIARARQELLKANRAIDSMETNLREVATAQDKVNSEMREGGSLAGGLASKVGGLIAAYATLEGAMSLARAADNYTNIKSRLDLINDGLQTTEQLQEMVRASANSTFSDYKSTADMVGKLGIQAGQAFSSNEEILRFAEQINKHIAIAGSSGAAAEGAMMQMTQAMSNGVLRGEELNSVLDGMPTVAKTIEAHFRKMGDTRGIKEIAEEGKITADIVKAALFTAAEETDAKFNAMGVTFADTWNLFKNHADKALTPVYKKLGELTNNKGFQTFAVTAGQAVSALGVGLVTVFDMLASMGGFIADNWAVVSPILAAVGGAIGTVLVAGIVTATKSLYAMAAAAWTANAPLLPWIAAGAAVAGIAYLIWQHSDKLRAAWEVLKTTVAGWATVAVAAWDTFKAKVSEVVTAVQTWWNGLGDSFTSRMATAVGMVIGFWASLPVRFWSFVAQIVVKAWNMRDQILQAGQNIASDVVTWAGKMFKNFVEWVKQIPGAVSDMVTDAGKAGMALADKAIEWGKGAYEAVKEWVGKIPSMIGDFLGGIKEGFTLNLSGGGGKVAQNAKGGIYGKGAFLTTFAEKSPEAAIPLDGSRRALGLWQQAGQMLGVQPPKRSASPAKIDIKLEVHNVNHISSDMDVNKVIQKITDKLYEALESGMEGAVV